MNFILYLLTNNLAVKKILTTLSLVWTIFISLGVQAHSGTTYPTVEYIENQGQWEFPFLFKGTTSKGDIYLQKNGFRLMMADAANHAKLDMLHHGTTKEKQTLRYHAYEMNFLNANTDFTVSGGKTVTGVAVIVGKQAFILIWP